MQQKGVECMKLWDFDLLCGVEMYNYIMTMHATILFEREILELKLLLSFSFDSNQAISKQ